MQRSSITVDGLGLSFLRRGRGEDVLFIHGLAAWSAVWEPLSQILAGTFRCTALDLPGHGRSDPPSGEFSLSRLSAVIVRFMEAAGLSRPIICAHSFGCLPVLAGLPSFDVRALVLVAPYLGDRRLLPWGRQLSSPERGRLFRVRVGERGLRKLFRDLLGPGADPDERTLARLFEPLADEERREGLVAFAEAAAGAPTWRDLKIEKPAFPVRIVCGGTDLLFDHEAVEEFAGRLEAPVEVFERSGHFPQLEEPRRLAEVIKQLARDVGP
jgi:pimeloyl-ACP methyl ester carboxylesterase